MIRCYCPEYCLLEGGNDSDGRPSGVTFTKSTLQSHKTRLQRERLAQQAVAQQVQARALEVAGAQLFASTLLDNHPVHNETTRSTDPCSYPSLLDNRSIQAITDGVRHIGLSPESGITGVEEEFHELSLETPLSRSQRPELLSNIGSPTSSQRRDKQYTREQSQYTKINLTQLDELQSAIRSSANTLLGLPSVEKIDKVKQLVGTWRQALASINRNVSLVTTRKTEVMELLRNLEARIAEIDIVSPSDPVEYRTSKSSP